MKEINITIPPVDRGTDEIYKALRTNLQFCGPDMKCILVTSSLLGEGKSTVSLQMAKVLADEHKKVLYIDADMRRSVHISRCQVTETVTGLSELLSGQVPLTESIYSTNIKGLHMMFSGPVPPNPAELLSNRYFEKLIFQVKKFYDYIIIDTPPLAQVIDAANIAKFCDGSILVIKAGSISRKLVIKTKEQLELAECPIIGAVLNQVQKTRKRRGYGYDYGYGYYK